MAKRPRDRLGEGRMPALQKLAFSHPTRRRPFGEAQANIAASC